MTFPALTAFYAAWLAIYYVALSLWVIMGRASGNVLLGDDGDQALRRRIRSHGNFAEYVPFALLLIALLEIGGANHSVVRTLLIFLVIARIMHPIGLFTSKNMTKQFACRVGGVVGTLGVMVTAAIMLLI